MMVTLSQALGPNFRWIAPRDVTKLPQRMLLGQISTLSRVLFAKPPFTMVEQLAITVVQSLLNSSMITSPTLGLMVMV